MKKVLNYIILAVLILFVIAAILLGLRFSAFTGEGVHSFLGYTRLDFSQTVYFIDDNTREVSGSSTFSVVGLVQPTDSNGSMRSFRGMMGVAQYPIALEQFYSDYVAASDSGMITVVAHTRESGNAYYWLMISAKNPEIYHLQIVLADGTSLSAYPGETAEEALANYDLYWESFPG